MGKAKKQVLDDDDAVFAQRAVELKGAPPSRALTPLPIKKTTILGTTAGPPTRTPTLQGPSRSRPRTPSPPTKLTRRPSPACLSTQHR